MSGLIPQACIDEVLQRTDLLELIDSYIPLKKQGRNYLACCPFHQEKNPSFNVIPKKQFYYCFGCGASGNAISFLMNYLHQNFVEAVENLALRLGIEVKQDNKSIQVKPNLSLYDLLSKVNHFFQKNLSESNALSYLEKRGISINTARAYQLGYAEPGWHRLEQQFKDDKPGLLDTGMLIKNEQGKIYDRYRDRLTFPIYDRYGKIIGFGGRALKAEDKPKYLNSPETSIFQKNRELYGLHQVLARNETPASLLVVEGYMDVIALAEHGVMNAVATLGTATSSMHIQLLNKYSSQIIFCFDGDEAGQKAAWRALEQSLPHLNSGLDLRFIFLPEEHDPDSLIRERGQSAFLTLVNEAIPLTTWLIQKLSQGVQIRTAIGKSQLLDKARPYLNQMPESTFKALFLEELARLTQLESRQIDKILTGKAQLKQPEKNPQSIGRSPLRLAVALILQDPGLIKHCADLLPLSIQTPEHALLQTLIQYIQTTPEINTGALLEKWRGNTYFEALSRLVAWDHLIPEENRLSELMDILQFIQKQDRETQVNALIEKARQGGLNSEEQKVLQQLLKQKHQKSAED